MAEDLGTVRPRSPYPLRLRTRYYSGLHNSLPSGTPGWREMRREVHRASLVRRAGLALLRLAGTRDSTRGPGN